ncbi:MAG: hypothetical protein JRG91_03785 [Deltaproteobacteria bacterium]|nr:hypothetical protein [Deltaproteobacteria bacterium]
MMTGTRAIAGTIAAAFTAATLLISTPAEAKSKATYVEIDMNLGMTTPLYQDMGLALSYGGMIGIGGKLKFLPPRFYFMAGVLHQTFRTQGSHALTGESFSARESLLDLSLGLRIVIPIYKGLRIYCDLMAIAAHHVSEVKRDSIGEKKSVGWLPGGLAALGVQYRWHRNASTGIRLEGTFYGPLDSAAMKMVGLEPEHNAKLVLALVQAWYF